MKKKIEFEFDGQKIVVKKPNVHQESIGKLHYAKAFKEALQFGAILTESLRDYMVEQGLITLEKQKEKLDLIKAIQEDREKLKDPKLDEKEGEMLAQSIAINVASYRLLNRAELLMLNNTAESVSDDARFNYFVSVCTYKEDGKPYFKDLNDYMERSEDEDAKLCAAKLASLIYDYDENAEENLPENVFLKKIKEKEKNENSNPVLPSIETTPIEEVAESST